MLQKLKHRYALMCSNSGPNFRAIHQSKHKLWRFKKNVAKRRKKKEKKNKKKIRAYLRNGLVDSAQIWNWRCPTPRQFTQKNFVCFCSGSAELQMCENSIFFTPVKCTLVYRIPKVSWFLGPHDTLPCVLIHGQ